mgnify:FL=1
MRRQRMPWAVPILLTLLMLGMSFSICIEAPENQLSHLKNPDYVGINQQTTLEIQTPNGSSSALKAEVTAGHSVESVDISISPDALAYSDGFTWSGESDWNSSGAVLDRVNVNKTDGLQLLPKKWEWDFESGPSNSPQGWTLGTGWYWGYDTSLGQSGGVHGGTKAIYTYNGNYPNNIPSSGYFATSPVIDCGGCSGTWDLKYWKRLGIESYYYDDAQVHVKNNQGNWITVWDWNSYTTNPSSFSLSTHDVSTYVNGNSNFQIRFKLGRTDGSVTYTGWNVDDVSLEPRSGSGGGEEANWTSARFGPSISGVNGMDGARYGITSIDATIPNGADIRLSVVDGVSKTPVPGYVDLDPTWVDLGNIDPEKHPSLRLKLYFDARGGAITPVVHKIHMNHVYGTSFGSNPTDAGWSLSGMNWNTGQISGSSGSIAESPLFTSHRPITQVQFSTSITGSSQIEVSLDGGPWQTVSASGITPFDDYASTFQFRITCSSSCSVSELSLEMIGGHLPTDPRFDIGQDGWTEWDVHHPHISRWGWQDRFTNGELSADMNWVTPGTKQIGLLLPKSGLESFSVDLSPFSTASSVDVSLSIGGNSVATKAITFDLNSERFTLTDSEILALNTELVNAPTYWGVGGEMHYIMATIDVQGTSGNIRVGGLSAIHRPVTNLSFPVDSAFVMSMNQAIPDAQLVSPQPGVEWRMVPLVMQSTSKGAYLATITDLVTSENVELDAASISNFSQWYPVTPSWQWMELNLSYSWDDGTPSHLSLAVETDDARAFYEFPVDGSDYSMTRLDGATNSPLIFSNNADGGLTIVEGADTLELSLPIRINSGLEDSSQLKLSASLYMDDGAPSQPYIQLAGQSSQGVENDLQLIDWAVFNELGYEIPESMSYLRSSSPISVEVLLGFEGMTNQLENNPRSGDVRVHLLQNGAPLMNTTNLHKGKAIFDFATQSGTGNVTFEVVVEPLSGQEFTSSITLNRTFTVDSLNPQIIGQNIAHYDHRLPSPNQLIRLEIYDRPVLPTDLTLMLWREWVDDLDMDGEIDSSEFVSMPLENPDDLSAASGNYTLTIDDTDAEDGDIVTGFVVGADPAGNSITEGGSSNASAQLFTYQVLPDGPPIILGDGGFASSVDGRLSYLHPGVDYEFALHIQEPNGWSDIDDLRLQLASNSITDTLAIEWSAEDGRCLVDTSHIDIQDCGVRAWSGELNPFTPDLEFYVKFQLNWSLPREGDMRWEPSIEVTDRSGQGAWLSLPQLRWRYSPDLAINTDTMSLNIGSGTYSDEGAWVSPGSTIALSGGIHFPVTGTLPSDDFNFRVLLDGEESLINSANGLWIAQISAPTESGSYPLTVEIADLPPGANDVTDTSAALRWIVVDSEGPEVVGVTSPRLDSILPIDSLSNVKFDIQISELEQIDSDSLILNWKIIRGVDVTATPLARGNAALVVQGGNLAGQSIIASSTLDISDSIPTEYYSEVLRLHIWVEGVDKAGNSVQTPLGSNSEDNPFATWSIEQRAAVFELSDGDVTYSKSGNVGLGESIMITVAVNNVGEVDGVARLYLTEVQLDGSDRELTAVANEEYIVAGQRKSFNIDWVPEKAGHQWVVVTLEDGTTARGPSINVVESEEDGFLGSVFGGVDILWVIMFLGLIILLGSVLMIALRSGGSRNSYLDETDDYWEDEDDWKEEPEDNVLPTGASSIPAGFPLDYRDETVREVMSQNGISDTIGFLQHARGFDVNNNGYLSKPELHQAAASFIAAGNLVKAQSAGVQPTFDPSTMTPEQLEWYEQAKQWGGYYDEAGNWIAL